MTSVRPWWSGRLVRCSGVLRKVLPRSDLPGAHQKTPLNLNRYVFLVVYLTGVGCNGPSFYNWPPFARLLFRNEAFAEKCKKDPVTGMYTPDLRRPRLPSGSSGHGGGDRGEGEVKPFICDAQETAVQQLYTLCTAVCSCCCVIAGVLMDACGPRITTVAGGFLQVAGWLMLGFADTSSSLYYGGLAVFAAGVDAIVLPALSVCRLFPAAEGFIITIIGSGLSASYAVPLIMNHLVENYGESFRTVVIRYALVCPCLYVILALFLMPKCGYQHFPVDKKQLELAEESSSAGGGGPTEGGGDTHERKEVTVAAISTHDVRVTNGESGSHHQIVDIEDSDGRKQTLEGSGDKDVGEDEKQFRGEAMQANVEGDKEGDEKSIELVNAEPNVVYDAGGGVIDNSSLKRRSEGVTSSRTECAWVGGEILGIAVKCVKQGSGIRKVVSNKNSWPRRGLGGNNSSSTRSPRKGRVKSNSNGNNRHDLRENSSSNSSSTDARLEIGGCRCAKGMSFDNDSMRNHHEDRFVNGTISTEMCAAASSNGTNATEAVEKATNSTRHVRDFTADGTATSYRCDADVVIPFDGIQKGSRTDASVSADHLFATSSSTAASLDPASPVHVSTAATTPVAVMSAHPATAAATSERYMVSWGIDTARAAMHAAVATHNSSPATTDVIASHEANVKSPTALHSFSEPVPSLVAEGVNAGGAASDAVHGAGASDCIASATGDQHSNFHLYNAENAVLSGAVGPGGNSAASPAAPDAVWGAALDSVGKRSRRYVCTEEIVAQAYRNSDNSMLQRNADSHRSICNIKTHQATAAASYEAPGAVEAGSARESVSLGEMAGNPPGTFDKGSDRRPALQSLNSSIRCMTEGSSKVTHNNMEQTYVVLNTSSSAEDSKQAEGESAARIFSHDWNESGSRSSLPVESSVSKFIVSRSPAAVVTAAGVGSVTEAAQGAATIQFVEKCSEVFHASTEAEASFSTAVDDICSAQTNPSALTSSFRKKSSSSRAANVGGATSHDPVKKLQETRSRYAHGWSPRSTSNVAVTTQPASSTQGAPVATNSLNSSNDAGTATSAEHTASSTRSRERSEYPKEVSSVTLEKSGDDTGDERGFCCCFVRRGGVSERGKGTSVGSPQRSDWRLSWKNLIGKIRSSSALAQIMSEHFLLIMAYKIVVVLVATYFQEASQRMFDARVLHVRATLLPFSCFPCILLGRAADRFGIVRVLCFMNFLGFGTYFFSFFTKYAVAWAYVSVVLFSCYMSFYSSQIFIYVEETFSSDHFGTFSGLNLLVGGLTSAATHPLYSHITVGLHRGDTLPVRIALSVLLLLANVLLARLVYLYKKDPHPFQAAPPAEDQPSDHTEVPGRCCWSDTLQKPMDHRSSARP